jgi:hypothetical protein
MRLEEQLLKYVTLEELQVARADLLQKLMSNEVTFNHKISLGKSGQQITVSPLHLLLSATDIDDAMIVRSYLESMPVPELRHNLFSLKDSLGLACFDYELNVRSLPSKIELGDKPLHAVKKLFNLPKTIDDKEEKTLHVAASEVRELETGYSGGYGTTLGVTPQQYDAIMQSDSKLNSNEHFKVNSSLFVFYEKGDAAPVYRYLQQQMAHFAESKAAVDVSMVFFENTAGAHYEFMMTLVRDKQSGKAHVVFTDTMQGKESFEKIFGIHLDEKSLESKSVAKIYHNAEPFPHTFKGGKATSCTGTAIALVFKAAECVSPQGEVSADKMISILTKPETIEIGPILDRANKAISAFNQKLESKHKPVGY